MRTFQEYLEAIRPSVNARIEQVARKKLKDDRLVRLLLGGKRLRAGILLLVFEGTSHRQINGVLDLACAVELAHSASLIVDDMLDEDEIRRGMPTLHLTEGHKRAMLDTIGVLSLPYDLVVPFGEDYVESLAETQRGMVTGVLRELLHAPDLPASKLYDTIIKQKTGKAFGLASSWGYLAGQNGRRRSDSPRARLWREYGIHVGKAMQIADDIADLRKLMEGRRNTGYGSELLLFKCVTAERLAQELFSDIKKLDLHFEKARELWSGEGAQRSLQNRLDNELASAEAVVEQMHLPESKWHRMLATAPGEISDMMLRSSGEQTAEKRVASALSPARASS